MDSETVDGQASAACIDGMSFEEMQRIAAEEQAAADAARRKPSHLKHVLHGYLFNINSSGGKLVNYTILSLIVVSVFISMLDTIGPIDAHWGVPIEYFQTAVLYIFLIEYLLRLYCANSAFKYARSFNGIIDLLTVVPLLFGAEAAVAVRLLRLLRLLKIATYFPVLQSLMRSVSGALNMLAAVFGTIGAISVMVGNLVYVAEPNTFANAFEGVWWSLVTMSTVGYGDVVPHTLLGKLLASVLILVGICSFAMVTAVISVRVGRMVNMTKKCLECDSSISPDYVYCPHCGQNQLESIDLFSDSE